MTYCLGVDLGTTSVAAAIADASDVEVLALGDRAPAMPAAVFVREDGELVTGEAAARWAVSEPERVATQFARRLGDPTPVLLGGTSYPLADLLSALLRDVLARAAEERGEPEEVVHTHPASWGRFRRELFEAVPRRAGLSAAVAVTESEAAAAYCAATRRLAEGEVIAVHDLGGGTFDATVLRRTADGMEVLGIPEGIERLGGADFDEAVLAHVNHATGGAVSELDLGDPTTAVGLARLRQDCVGAKEALSVDTETTVPVFLPGRHVVVRLTRSQFEDMVRAPVESTIGALSRALRTAEVPPSRLSAVLLIGGSAHIPLIERMIAAEFGRPVVVDAQPTHAVALGAAMLARARTGVPVPVAEALATTSGATTVGTALLAPVPAPRPPAPAEERVPATVGAAAETLPVAAVAVVAAGPPAAPPTIDLPPTSGNGHGPAPSEPLVPGTEPADDDVPTGRRGALIAVAGLFTTLVLGVVLAFLVLRDDGTPTASNTPSPEATAPAPVDESTPEAAPPPPAPAPTPAPAVPVPVMGTPIPVGPTPGFAAVSPDGRQLYVTDRDDGVVTVLDTAATTVTATIEVTAGPPRSLALSPDGSRLYVSVFDDADTVHAVDVIDTTTGTDVATIPMRDRPYPGAVTPDGKRLFVPSQDAGTISVIDTTTNAIVNETQVPPDPHSIGFTQDGRFAYVANHHSNVITALDTATLDVVASVGVGTSPHSLAVNPVRPLVANVNYDSGNVSFTDTNTNAVVATVPVGEGPQHVAWSADGRFAYTANSTDDSVSVINADTFQETARLPVGDGPTSVAVLPDGSRAFVTMLHEGLLVPLDLTG